MSGGWGVQLAHSVAPNVMAAQSPSTQHLSAARDWPKKARLMRAWLLTPSKRQLDVTLNSALMRSLIWVSWASERMPVRILTLKKLLSLVMLPA